MVAGQSCCSALNSWAARQRRPTKDVKIFVLRPFRCKRWVDEDFPDVESADIDARLQYAAAQSDHAILFGIG